jgi:hypothetical protein
MLLTTASPLAVVRGGRSAQHSVWSALGVNDRLNCSLICWSGTWRLDCSRTSNDAVVGLAGQGLGLLPRGYVLAFQTAYFSDQLPTDQ